MLGSTRRLNTRRLSTRRLSTNRTRLTRRWFGTSLAAAAIAATLGAAPPCPDRPEPSLHADFGTELQSIDGFGFSQAFQRAHVMNGARGLPEDKQREVLDLLLSRETGAGLSILRLGIGSSSEDPYDLMKSIQPEDPGGPDAPPQYVWDGYDGGQVWLAKEAQKYGVERFYADAWSAPGYMKTNGSDSNGGTLKPEWREAYAEYLVQYARFYAQEGIEITDLGFTNEPDLSTSYASMQFTPEEAAEVAKVVGKAIDGSELSMNLICCDAAGWEEQRAFTKAIEADPEAAAAVGIHAGHNYVSQARSPLPTDRHVWMSEWNPNGDTWKEAWDDGTGWDGISVAEDIHATLAEAEANAYVFWFGASLGATRALIQLDGAEYHVSKRLWALAAYSRFIRPDAERVEAGAESDSLKITAFRNADGSRVLEILNTGTENVREQIAVGGDRTRGQVHLTDEQHSVAERGTAVVRDGRLSVELPARSLTTVVLDH